ncbi:MAG: flagellar hook-associated protein FlgL [Verrucomicrobiae bacterium]|nr:flagellar hook-associated protein FlgL [Verrucomicrobiae bacterium]
MRVPFLNSNQSFINQVNSLNQKQVDLQKQLSQGQRVSEASEDPLAIGRALTASSGKAKLQTYARNLDRAEFVGNYTLETLEQFKEVADTVVNLTNSNDGLTTAGDLQARGYQTNQLVGQALQLLNSELSGDYLFGGANTGEVPFVAHYYTEFLTNENGDYIDLEGNVLGGGDSPVASVYVDNNGDIIFDQALDSGGNPIPENTYVDPATGYQTDASGNPLPGPVSLTAGIDFNTGELVELSSATGSWINIPDSDGNPIIPPAGPDISGTGFITTTRKIPPELIGQVSFVEYTGTSDPASDIAFRVGQNSSIAPFSRGLSNVEYATFVNDLISFRDAYFSEDIDAVKASAPNFNDSQELITFGMVELGSKLQSIEMIGRLNETRFNELETNISNDIDIDIAEAIVKLNGMQTAYQAALSSGARIMNTSLLDYLS